MKYRVTSESESELAEDLEVPSVGVTAKERDVVRNACGLVVG